ncbi:MAG: right-handed parallel beta-helix repeat-containing protein [Planctomycetes bacterium]|nr:right-handed parallel beta-helix repeat-containing protein [Planctomycetota bacterium]
MARPFRTILIMLFVVSVPSASQAQTTWHVDDDCAPPGAGTIPDPFCTIQDGVDASENGDTVEVQPGTYTGAGNRDISMFGKAITLKSSDGPSATVIDIQGSPSSIHRGFFLIHGETCQSIIRGFTIENGYLIGDTGGTGPLGGGGGAGIFIRDSSPTIRDCVIRDNTSETLGIPLLVDGRAGGIYIDGNSRAVIERCVIIGNTADKRGGGMYVGFAETEALISSCLFSANNAGSGGGVYNTFSRTTFVNCTITGNIAVGGGGFRSENSRAFLSNCAVWANIAEFGPQIQVSCPGSPVIEYSTVQGGAEAIHADCPVPVEWG